MPFWNIFLITFDIQAVRPGGQFHFHAHTEHTGLQRSAVETVGVCDGHKRIIGLEAGNIESERLPLLEFLRLIIGDPEHHHP